MLDPTVLVADVITVTFADIGRSLVPRLNEYIATANGKRVFKRVVWVLCVVLLLAVSAAAIFGIHAAFNSYKPGIICSVILWSLFFGTTASLLLPNKVIVATFGGLVGVSLSEIATAAGLISILRKQVVAIAVEIGAIANPNGQPSATPDPFITWMIWLFVVITAVLCLPAFFEKDQA